MKMVDEQWNGQTLSWICTGTPTPRRLRARASGLPDLQWIAAHVRPFRLTTRSACLIRHSTSSRSCPAAGPLFLHPDRSSRRRRQPTAGRKTARASTPEAEDGGGGGGGGGETTQSETRGYMNIVGGILKIFGSRLTVAIQVRGVNVNIRGYFANIWIAISNFDPN
jgi:hypothetical protein